MYLLLYTFYKVNEVQSLQVGKNRHSGYQQCIKFGTHNSSAIIEYNPSLILSIHYNGDGNVTEGILNAGDLIPFAATGIRNFYAVRKHPVY